MLSPSRRAAEFLVISISHRKWFPTLAVEPYPKLEYVDTYASAWLRSVNENNDVVMCSPQIRSLSTQVDIYVHYGWSSAAMYGSQIVVYEIKVTPVVILDAC